MKPGQTIKRHSLATRVTHWINAVCVLLVLMSGLQIFNAHPRLYWGQSGANAEHAVLRIDSKEPAFPTWSTIPGWQDLAAGRRWHFFFAWILVFNSLAYLLISATRGHLRRDLTPRRSELAPRHLASDVWQHLRLRFPTGDAARQYNTLQKLTYLGMIFVVAPLMLATGLTLSPGADAALPWLLDVFGGRQSARTIHFFSAMAIVTFILIHLLMVALAGPWNELRSMITGWYVLPDKKRKAE